MAANNPNAQMNANINVTTTGAAQVVNQLNNLKNAVGGVGGQAQQIAPQIQNLNRNVQQTARGMANMPTFIQFAFMPFASLARQFGADGLSKALFTMGDVAGVVDNAQIMGQTIQRLGNRLRAGDGIMSRLANTAGYLFGGVFGNAAGNIASVVAAFAPLGLAIGGLSLLLGELQRQFEEAKKKGEDYVAGRTSIADMIADGGTTEDVTERRGELLRRQGVRQNLIDELLPLVEEFDRLRGAARNPAAAQRLNEIQTAIERIFGEGANIDSARRAIEVLRSEMGELTPEIDAANAALATNATRHNDDAAAAAASDEALDSWNEGRVQAQLRASKMTTRQLEDTIADIDAQIQAYTAGLAGATAEQAVEFNKQIALLRQIRAEYADALPTNFAEWFKQNSAAIKKYMDEVRQLTADFIREGRRIAEERGITSRREVEDYERQRMRTKRDFEREQQRADEEENRRVMQKNKESVRRAEDFAERIRKILEDLWESLFDAVADRDAEAYHRAQRAAAKQIRDAQQEQQKDDRRRAEDEADEDQYRRRARQYRLEDFRRRLQEEDEDRRIRLQRLVEDNTRQDRIRREDMNYRIQQLTQQLNTETGLWQATTNVMQFYLNYGRSAFENFIRGITGAIPGANVATPIPMPIPLPPPNPANMPITQPPLTPVSPFPAPVPPVHITVNANGLNARQAEEIAYNAITRVHKDARRRAWGN